MVDGLSLMFSSRASVVKGQCVSRHSSGSPRTPWCPSSLAPLLRFYPLICKASCFSLFIYLSFPQSSSHHTPPNPPPPHVLSLILFLFNSIATCDREETWSTSRNLILTRKKKRRQNQPQVCLLPCEEFNSQPWDPTTNLMRLTVAVIGIASDSIIHLAICFLCSLIPPLLRKDAVAGLAWYSGGQWGVTPGIKGHHCRPRVLSAMVLPHTAPTPIAFFDSTRSNGSVLQHGCEIVGARLHALQLKDYIRTCCKWWLANVWFFITQLVLIGSLEITFGLKGSYLQNWITFILGALPNLGVGL